MSSGWTTNLSAGNEISATVCSPPAFPASAEKALAAPPAVPVTAFGSQKKSVKTLVSISDVILL